MQFLMFVKSDPRAEAGVLPTEKELQEMGEFNNELIKSGIMLAGEGLHGSTKGTRVTIDGKKTRVVDGPFAEAKELVAGFWAINVKSKDEAIEVAKRVCFREGEVEVREVYAPEAFPDVPRPPTPQRKPGTTRFMVLLKADKNTESNLEPTPELEAAMGALIEEVIKSGALLAGDGLRSSQYGAKVLYAGDKRTVIDGPFTETKEIVAGYTIVQFATKTEAVEFGRRMLQIHIDGTGIGGGEVEVRPVFEIEDFPVSAEEKPDGWRAIETNFRDRVEQ
ncbi:MAG TPA: YciI family protein [Polyangiaceae bacterium]|nr:YciI family protein [Polyangiaceae bacterium]